MLQIIANSQIFFEENPLEANHESCRSGAAAHDSKDTLRTTIYTGRPMRSSAYSISGLLGSNVEVLG